MGGDVAIRNYTFAEVDNTKGLGPAWLAGHFDGICGMGRDDISVDHVTTPLRALVNSKKLGANQFAFYLGSGGAVGELVLGGLTQLTTLATLRRCQSSKRLQARLATGP